MYIILIQFKLSYWKYYAFVSFVAFCSVKCYYFTCYLDISFHCMPSPPLSSIYFAGCDSVIGYKLGLSCLFLLQVLLWRTSTFDYVDTAEGHSHLITDVRFRPNSSTFATSSFDKTMQIWDAKKVNLSLSLFIWTFILLVINLHVSYPWDVANQSTV